jgi:hypothetical protein
MFGVQKRIGHGEHKRGYTQQAFPLRRGQNRTASSADARIS